MVKRTGAFVAPSRTFEACFATCVSSWLVLWTRKGASQWVTRIKDLRPIPREEWRTDRPMRRADDRAKGQSVDPIGRSAEKRRAGSAPRRTSRKERICTHWTCMVRSYDARESTARPRRRGYDGTCRKVVLDRALCCTACTTSTSAPDGSDASSHELPPARHPDASTSRRFRHVRVASSSSLRRLAFVCSIDTVPWQLRNERSDGFLGPAEDLLLDSDWLAHHPDGMDPRGRKRRGKGQSNLRIPLRYLPSSSVSIEGNRHREELRDRTWRCRLTAPRSKCPQRIPLNLRIHPLRMRSPTPFEIRLRFGRHFHIPRRGKCALLFALCSTWSNRPAPNAIVDLDLPGVNVHTTNTSHTHDAVSDEVASKWTKEAQ